MPRLEQGEDYRESSEGEATSKPGLKRRRIRGNQRLLCRGGEMRRGSWIKGEGRDLVVGQWKVT